MRFFSVLVICSVLLLSCENPAQQSATPVYFDTKAFVDQQVTLLEAQKPTVRKVMMLKGESQRQQTTTLDWTRELELFQQANINKPAFRTSYTIDRPDSLTYRYTLKASEERLTVRVLSVRLDSATRQPALITATLVSENPLYQSERNIRLESGLVRGKWRVRHYRLEGFQQLTFFGRNTFRVDGEIL
jgi:hypothetical protein